MPVYRLDPILKDDPSWRLSTIKEAVFAGAENPDKARELVASKTLVMQAVQTGVQRLLRSPWLIDPVTNCVWYPDKNDIPAGVVVTVADGREI